MEFRAPAVAVKNNAAAIEYFTKNLSDKEAGQALMAELIKELGDAINNYPFWHPILTAPSTNKSLINGHPLFMSMIDLYSPCDHTVEFTRGFITCPYNPEAADKLVKNVNKVSGLRAYRINEPLYADNAYPVVVEALEVVLEADGTIRSRDAIRWFVETVMESAETAQVAETWWNIRSLILGKPHGSRSSLCVNQHAGSHMRKILEALNDSGIFGEIKESSLDMLSEKKRNKISENVLRAAIKAWDGKSEEYTFELRDELCKANLRDTWRDGTELSIRVTVGKDDLSVRSFYYPEQNAIDPTSPTGKRLVAEKFL